MAEPALSTEDLVTSGDSPIHGTGVFARVALAEGAHVGTYTGLASAVDGTYVLWVEGDDGHYHGIDGEGVLRWLNHSPAPNTEFDGPELYALQAIDAGEELTFDYGEEWNQ